MQDFPDKGYYPFWQVLLGFAVILVDLVLLDSVDHCGTQFGHLWYRIFACDFALIFPVTAQGLMLGFVGHDLG